MSSIPTNVTALFFCTVALLDPTLDGLLSVSGMLTLLLLAACSVYVPLTFHRVRRAAR
jgi:hypothetical protein